MFTVPAVPADALPQDMPVFSATQLVAGMQKVNRAVMAHGAVVVTRHEQPAMVLMSVDRYLELQQAAEPGLAALSEQFDGLFERMQGADAAERMARAFAMEPEALGQAAVRAAGAKRPAVARRTAVASRRK